MQDLGINGFYNNILERWMLLETKDEKDSAIEFSVVWFEARLDLLLWRTIFRVFHIFFLLSQCSLVMIVCNYLGHSTIFVCNCVDSPTKNTMRLGMHGLLSLVAMMKSKGLIPASHWSVGIGQIAVYADIHMAHKHHM